jgi:hypothetical protein
LVDISDSGERLGFLRKTLSSIIFLSSLNKCAF